MRNGKCQGPAEAQDQGWQRSHSVSSHEAKDGQANLILKNCHSVSSLYLVLGVKYGSGSCEGCKDGGFILGMQAFLGCNYCTLANILLPRFSLDKGAGRAGPCSSFQTFMTTKQHICSYASCLAVRVFAFCHIAAHARIMQAFRPERVPRVWCERTVH